jgi:site-specific recombinase XerD
VSGAGCPFTGGNAHNEGVSIRLISAYLGHTSLETTLIYTHLTAVNEASARTALDHLKPAT